MTMRVPERADIGRRVTLVGNLGTGVKYRGTIRAITLASVVIDATEAHYGRGWESLDPKGRGRPECRQVRGALIIEEEDSGES